jgi:HD-like signal output (HDOD) protein
LPPEISGQRFFHSFAHAYRENKLRLPSLPDVAFKLKEAMQKDIGIKEAVEIIYVDPPIVTKMIQVANSALYSNGVPCNNCFDAVSRIGLQATRNLVMGISLKQLFKCHDPDLMKGMQTLWKNSLYVSSLSFVLAQECSNINPEDALLAGLIADIGAIPLLHFAEQFPDEYPSFQELNDSLPFLRAPVGALVLHTLGFSEQMTNIPHHAENWLYDSGPDITLDDIVILAKLHSYFGSGKARNLPYINSIPAYSKLKDGKLNPDFSLNVLQKAQLRINAAMHMLS